MYEGKRSYHGMTIPIKASKNLSEVGEEIQSICSDFLEDFKLLELQEIKMAKFNKTLDELNPYDFALMLAMMRMPQTENWWVGMKRLLLSGLILRVDHELAICLKRIAGTER